MEALACVGNIAKAMGTVMEPHFRDLLDAMYSTGLSVTLVEALEQLSVRYTLENREMLYFMFIFLLVM